MKLVMTLLARDEADIIDAHLAFHLNAGVDFVVATDHSSTDGTTDVLNRYAAEGVLHLLHESGTRLRQSRWVSRMARLAATEFQADWVINSDADEFWWPSGGNLKEVLALVPGRYGVVHSFVRTFLPSSGSGPFAERMTIRLALYAPVNDPSTTFRGGVRLCHRSTPDVVVATGNIAVTGIGLPALRGWPLIEVLHFPIRSYEHFERKFLAHFASVGGERVDHGRAVRAAHSGRLQALYDEVYASSLLTSSGLGDRSLVVDTRLRDALRSLAAAQLPLSFPPMSFPAQTSTAAEGAAVEEAELVRLVRRVDELEHRVASIEVR